MGFLVLFLDLGTHGEGGLVANGGFNFGSGEVEVFLEDDFGNLGSSADEWFFVFTQIKQGRKKGDGGHVQSLVGGDVATVTNRTTESVKVGGVGGDGDLAGDFGRLAGGDDDFGFGPENESVIGLEAGRNEDFFLGGAVENGDFASGWLAFEKLAGGGKIASEGEGMRNWVGGNCVWFASKNGLLIERRIGESDGGGEVNLFVPGLDQDGGGGKGEEGNEGDEEKGEGGENDEDAFGGFGDLELARGGLADGFADVVVDEFLVEEVGFGGEGFGIEL